MIFRMENENNNLLGKRNLIKKTKIKFDINIEKSHFFNDEYARKNNKWISNKNIRNRLSKEAVLEEMVANYKFFYKKNIYLNRDYSNNSRFDLNFYDCLVYFNIILIIAKGILRYRKKKKINLLEDLFILNKYYADNNSIFRNKFEDVSSKNDVMACLHPYIQRLFLVNDSELLEFMESNDYRKLEADFVRTANGNHKRINDLLISNFIKCKKIFICRFDIILRDDGNAITPGRCSIQKYRKQVEFFLKSAWQFDHALDVIFPAAIITGEINPSNLPVGQLVLVSTDRVGANKKALEAFASQDRRSDLLDFQQARPFPKEIVPCVDGVLEFTPSTVEAINRLAEFLTIERRFVAPRQAADGTGTTHCIRFLELKR